MKQAVMAFVIGALLSGGALGAYAFFEIHDLKQANKRLQAKVHKQSSALQELTWKHELANEELELFQKQQSQNYDGALGQLLEAKENAANEALYKMGLKALEEEDFSQAYYALAQVRQNNPDYKQVQAKYQRAEAAYKQSQQDSFQDKLNSTYLKAFDQQAKQQYALAQKNYRAVLKMQPNYKDAKKRLQVVSHQLAVIQRSRQSEQIQKMVATSYKQGYNHQSNGRYAQAKAAYEVVVKYMPKYKDAQKRLQQVAAKLPKTAPVAQQNALVGMNCYQKGVIYGRCAAQALDGKPCAQMNTINKPPPECQSDPEFAKGLQSVVSAKTGTQMNGLGTRSDTSSDPAASLRNMNLQNIDLSDLEF